MSKEKTDTPRKITWSGMTHRGKVRANKAGKPAVNIPDLDAYNEPDAQRVDPDLVSTFAHVERIEDGKGWTFGHRGALKLKGNIRAVRIEKLPAKG